MLLFGKFYYLLYSKRVTRCYIQSNVLDVFVVVNYIPEIEAYAVFWEFR